MDCAGICNGSHVYDTKGVCCDPGLLDGCGVCNGNNACITTENTNSPSTSTTCNPADDSCANKVEKSSSSDKTWQYAVAGSVVGFVVLAVAVAIILAILVRRRRNNPQGGRERKDSGIEMKRTASAPTLTSPTGTDNRFRDSKLNNPNDSESSSSSSSDSSSSSSSESDSEGEGKALSQQQVKS